MKIRPVPFFLFFAAALCAPLGKNEVLRAETAFGPGCMSEYSPFYQKLLRAGVLSVPVAPATGQAEPMKNLFTKAHLFRYAPDSKQRGEVWQSAEETARLFKGDCADKAIWLYTHLRQNGYQNVSLVIGRYSPTSKMLHMWVLYEEPAGNKLLLDPTIQRKPWKVTDFSKRYYKPLYMLSGEDCVAF